MRASQVLALALLVSTTGVAVAGEAVHLTPPLYREQARETQQVRQLTDLSTTPQPVAKGLPASATRTVRVVADAETTASH